MQVECMMEDTDVSGMMRREQLEEMLEGNGCAPPSRTLNIFQYPSIYLSSYVYICIYIKKNIYICIYICIYIYIYTGLLKGYDNVVFDSHWSIYYGGAVPSVPDICTRNTHSKLLRRSGVRTLCPKPKTLYPVPEILYPKH